MSNELEQDLKDYIEQPADNYKDIVEPDRFSERLFLKRLQEIKRIVGYLKDNPTVGYKTAIIEIRKHLKDIPDGQSI